MQLSNIQGCRERRAYTFVEVMVAVAVVGVMVVSLYLCIATSFSIIQQTRENLRASQIMMQRVETVRLYTWDQLRNVTVPARFQTNFTEVYDPLSVTNGTGGGVVYAGGVSVTVPPPVLAGITYRSNVALVSVTIRWTNLNGSVKLPHVRQFQTLVAKSGMQKYVYGQ